MDEREDWKERKMTEEDVGSEGKRVSRRRWEGKGGGETERGDKGKGGYRKGKRTRGSSSRRTGMKEESR